MFNIETNMHNKHLGRLSMDSKERMGFLATEQYGIIQHPYADIQELNIRLFYDLLLLDSTPDKSTFIKLVSNYELVFHRISSMALQQVGIPKKPIFYTFTTLQDMLQTHLTIYVYS